MLASDLYRRFTNSIRYGFLKLTRPLLHYGERYILRDLVNQSLSNGSGYAKVSLLFGMVNFVVFTGKEFVQEAVVYGEDDPRDSTKYDPQSRSVIQLFIDFLGAKTLSSWHGPEVNIRQERKVIKEKMLGNGQLYDVTVETFEALLNNWSDKVSMNDLMHKACVDIVGQVVFGLPLKTAPLNDHCYDLLGEAEHVIFDSAFIRSPDFDRVSQELKAYNAQYVAEHEKDILATDNYTSYLAGNTSDHLNQLNGNRKLSVKEWNPIGSLVAASNVTAFLTYMMVKLAEDQSLQDQLRKELSVIDLKKTEPKELYHQLRNNPIINGIIKESMRMFSGTPTVIRYASKGFSVNNVQFPARTYLIVPWRELMQHPQSTWQVGAESVHWENPEKFDINRKFPAAFPLYPFSMGGRSCPAQGDLVPTMATFALAIFCSQHRLKLLSPNALETFPPHVLEPRLKQSYFAELTPVAAMTETNTPFLTAYREIKRSNQRKLETSAITQTTTLEESGVRNRIVASHTNF